MIVTVIKSFAANGTFTTLNLTPDTEGGKLTLFAVGQTIDVGAMIGDCLKKCGLAA